MNLRLLIIGLVSVFVLVASYSASAKPPSWDKKIDSPGRFKVLSQFNSEAVLDKETGLVWERSPDFANYPWDHARAACPQRETGQRLGWRLPSMAELSSLLDPTQDGIALTTGHPFENVSSTHAYWTTTTYPPADANAFAVFFPGGGLVLWQTKITSTRTWCVRGGHGNDDGQ